jgi:hypothetical protein
MPVNRIAHLLSTHGEMPRPKLEPKAKLGTYISEDLFAELQEYHKDSGIPITRIVEDALTSYLTSRYRMGHHSEDETPKSRRRKS